MRKKSGWNEFDIVMYNGDSVGIIEAKNRANPKYLQVEKQIRNFKEQFPEFQGYKIFYGVATMSTKNNDLFDFCKSKGLFLLCQNGDHIDLRAPLSMHKWHIMGIKLAELRFKMLPICLILLASCALLCRIFYLILHSSCINRGALNQ